MREGKEKKKEVRVGESHNTRFLMLSILGMKLRRMIGQEETEPKVAQDSCPGSWQCSTEGRSTYTSALFFFLRKRK